MDDVTIDDLLQHRAGIPEVPRGNNLDEMALSMGISSLQWTPKHMIRWTYGLDRIQSNYSSNGHFLLRFLANEILKTQGHTIESFLENEMGLADIVVSRKDYAARLPRQAGYVITDFSHTDVWLDDFFALDASAEAYMNYSSNYHPFYNLVSESYVGVHGGHNGGMDGAVSFYRSWSQNGKQRNLIVNLTKADATASAIETFVNNLTQKSECEWGNYATPNNGSFFIRNHWKPNQYFNAVNGFHSSPFATKPSHYWTLELLSNGDFYIKRGSDFLYINSSNQLVLGALNSSNSSTSRWQIEALLPNDPNSPLIRIRNAGNLAIYINNENQSSENPNYPLYGVQATTIQSGWLSSVWTLCRS